MCFGEYGNDVSHMLQLSQSPHHALTPIRDLRGT